MNHSASTALKVVLVLECVGALAVAMRAGSPPEQICAGLAVGVALAIAFGLDARAAYAVAVWFVAVAVLKSFGDEHPFAWTSVPAHATRYGVALALARPRQAMTILRVATSLTFAAHGIESIGLNPKFAEYLGFMTGLVGLELGRATPILLRVIGSIDILLATAMLVRGPRPFTAGYMGIWGAITALIRTLYSGLPGLADTVLRAANAGAPFALWLSTRETHRKEAAN